MNSKLNKENIYNFFLGSLIIINLLVYYFKFYLEPNKEYKPQRKVELTLIPENNISTVSYLSVQNRFGLIEFLKESPSPYPWIISNHNNLLAETTKVENLLKSLQKIKIKRQIKGDQISLKNYSMEDPYLLINFLIPGLPLTKLKIGLVNDLKKVAYLQYGNSNMIYEASYRSLTLFDDNFSSFTNKSPFNFISTSATKVELTRNSKTQILIKKKAGQWYKEKKQGPILNQKKVEKWLNDIGKIKTEFILDRLSEKQKGIIEDAKKPWNRTKLIICTDEDSIFEYDLYLTPKILEKNKKRKRHYVLFDKFRAYPIVLKGEIKKLLKVTSRSFL